MEDRDLNEIADKIASRLNTKDNQSLIHADFEEWKELHKHHHEFISMEIEKRKSRKEQWERFRASFIGAIAVASASALVYIGKIVIEFIQSVGTRGL